MQLHMYCHNSTCCNSTVILFHVLFPYFGNLQISAVRLPREPSHPERLKGFGYAEFDDVESLLRALSLSEEVRGCPKISVFLFLIHLKLNTCWHLQI